MSLFKWLRPRATAEHVQIQEIRELHDLAQQVFLRREMEGGLTQAKLAERAGMTQAQIANIEAGHANPTVRSLAKLAHALGCRIRDLFDEDEPTARSAFKVRDEPEYVFQKTMVLVVPEGLRAPDRAVSVPPVRVGALERRVGVQDRYNAFRKMPW